ncbi:efflux RND transporter periplasmic adaptor subunit [Methylogaea oryzae]|uniref:RND transporter n=1 Tax=Methylogaea oryzae TaxID=1295382 RepID=A0A8D4VPK2_9GAMM|nr:efflux RND transporter periplasmic adaptor subunit [Methylogaea oryzae]BBL71718.1 RND transporter [Methylogaea oryzae]
MTRIAVLAVAALLGLAACHSDGGNVAQEGKAKVIDGQVVLPAGSHKLAYIKERVLELSPRPLMEPVAGKLTYDDTRTVHVTSPIAGRVVSSLPSLGASVSAGQPLIELDSPELGQAQTDYADALADLRMMERAYRRSKELYEGQVAPRKDFEQAQDNFARSQAEVQRTRMRLANLGVANGQVDNRFSLRSPLAGLITERNVNPGMEVRPDLASPLFVVSDISQLWVLANVYEKDLGLIHVGREARVSVPAYPGEVFVATVGHIDQVVDEATRTVRIRCVLPNPDRRLLPGMYATVDVHGSPEERAVVIPLTAVFTEGDSDSVFVALGGGRFQRRDIKIGLRLKDMGVVEQGLQAGERLVTEGALLLRAEEANAQEAAGS